MLDISQVFFSHYNFSRQGAAPYSPISANRDKWLQEFAQSEPYLASVLHGAVSIDKNRAWTITGSERQVNRFVAKFHAFEGGLGWRTFMSKAAQAYYSSDMGFVGLVELNEDNQLQQVVNISPHHCQLKTNYFAQATYDRPIPKDYDMVVQRPSPTGSETMYLNHADLDYIRVVSMPNSMTEYNGLGFCAVSRCVEWATIMKAVYNHNNEQLLNKAPKGLLLLQGITDAQWEQSMQETRADINNYDSDYHGRIKVLASLDSPIEAKLVALSQLPKDFNLKEFTDLLMYGYSLAFGYPADEFWPLQGGSFGHSREVEMNEQRSSSKGVGNFILDLQEEIQRLLPRSLHFEFSRRDTSGDISEATLAKTKVDTVNALFDKGAGVISRDEARSLLAEAGVIPNEWTLPQEEVTGNDSKPQARMLRDELLDKHNVAKARELFPSEKIVTFQWPLDKLTVLHNPRSNFSFRTGGNVSIKPTHVKNALAKILKVA